MNMASQTILQSSSVFSPDLWRPFLHKLESSSSSSSSLSSSTSSSTSSSSSYSSSSSSSSYGSLRFGSLPIIGTRLCYKASGRVKVSYYHKSLSPPVKCSHADSAPSSDSNDDQNPPQEAILKAISEVSKTEGRVAQTTNLVIGGTVTDESPDEWLALDQKVNSYPTVRGFTAIGTGGDDFVQSMVVAVESVLQQPIPEGRISQRVSSRGKYVSVNIGPVRVVSSEQVQAVYNAMRRDDRMKYFL